jgi:uncharacterized protein
MEVELILKQLPGKDCGGCGMKTCADLAEVILTNPTAIHRCPFLEETGCSNCPSNTNCIPQPKAEETFKKEITWHDNLGREYDFILDKYPGEIGPRETIILFNPANVEKLQIKKGDICYGRPAWISCGCPLTHCGIVVEEPDYFNGTFIWCITGPLNARDPKAKNIGFYNTTAYEGIVKFTKVDLKIGMRHFFQPRYCMLQWRHSGLINQLTKTPDGLKVRIEGLLIG